MKRLLALILISVVLWAAGFVWFVMDARTPPPVAPVCDGIVVLTGGQSRIDASVSLLKGGYGQLLLISGVGPHVTLHHLSKVGQEPLPESLSARITLGRRAVSTIGNAHETADWAHTHELHKLLIVTAGYHMRRALLEISRTDPDLTLIPYPVVPPALDSPLSRPTIWLLLREYSKFLGAELSFLTGLPDGTDGLSQH